MISILPGVILQGLQPEILIALMNLTMCVPEGITITSALDGEHMLGSKHYIGQAIDVRTFNWGEGQKQELRECLRGLGRDYDVVQEHDHLHIEFDPK